MSSTSKASPSTNRKQIRHWSLTEIENCPFLSRSSSCNRLLGGTFKSSSPVARSKYSSFRIALRVISDGNRFDFPCKYKSRVCLSANVLITAISVMCHVTCVNRSLLKGCRLKATKMAWFCVPGLKSRSGTELLWFAAIGVTSGFPISAIPFRVIRPVRKSFPSRSVTEGYIP